MTPEADPLAIDRGRFAALADAVLPAFGDLPAASAVGVAGPLLDRALAVLPALRPVLHEVLALPGDDVPSFLAELKASSPSRFGALVLATAAAYYLAPEVREAIGYQGQEAQRVDPFEVPSYLEDGRLDRVIARGPLYRDPDGGAAT